MDDNFKQDYDSAARCNFCNRLQPLVKKLIAGPGGVYICDNCVELAHSIIFTELKPEEDENHGAEISHSLRDQTCLR